MSDITTLNKAVSKILRALAESASKEISTLVQDNYATLCLELYQSKGEINKLKKSLALLAESTTETIHNVTYSHGMDMEYEDEHNGRESDVTTAASATGIKVLVPMATDMKSMITLGPQNPAALNKLRTHVTCFPKVEKCPQPVSVHPSPSTPPPGSPHPHSSSFKHLHPPPTQHPPNNQNTSQTPDSDDSDDSCPPEYGGEKVHAGRESDLIHCNGSLSLWGAVATSATAGIHMLVPVGPDTIKSRTSAGPRTTVTSNKLRTHVTCFPIGECPKVERCTSCCDLYHCPFCQPSVFKPREYHRIIPHLQIHLHQAIRTNEFVICKCRLACREPPHFHCCYCQHTQIRRSGIVKHISNCQKLSKRRPPPTSAQGGPPPSPRPSPSSTPPPGSPHPLDRGAPPSYSLHHPPAQHPPNDQNTTLTLNSDSSPSLLPRDVSSTQSTGMSPRWPSGADRTWEEVPGMDSSEFKLVSQEPSSRPPTTRYTEASPTLHPPPPPLPLQHVGETPPLPLHPLNVPAQETRNMPPQGAEFKVMEGGEAWSKGGDFKVPRVLSPCHICGMLLQKRNHKIHLQKWHQEEFNPGTCGITLKKGLNHARCRCCDALVRTQDLRKHMRTKHQCPVV